MKLKAALVHNTIWSAITLIMTFAMNVIIARLLGAKAGADFFYFLAILTLISTFLRLGVESGIVWISAKYPESTGPLLLLSGFLLLVQAILIATGYLIIRPGNGAGEAMWIIAYITASTGVYYLSAFYQAKKMFVSNNVFRASIACLQVLLFTALLTGTHGFAPAAAKNIFWILTTGLILQVIAGTGWFLKQQSAELSFKWPKKEILLKLRRYSVFSFAAAVLFYLITRADFYFVEKYCSKEVMGNYVQVAKIGQMALVLPGLLGGVIFPFSVSAENNFAEKIAFFCRITTLAFLVFFIGMFFFGDPVLTMLLGNDFPLVNRGILLALPGIWSLALSIILVSFFEGQNDQKIILASYSSALVLLIIADRIFVPMYGYAAAATVFSLANIFGTAVLIKRILNKSSVRIADIFLPRKYDLKFLSRRRENAAQQ